MPASKVDSEAVEQLDYGKSAAPLRKWSGASSGTVARGDGQQRRNSTRQSNVAALLQNPLSGMSDADVLEDVDAFVDAKGLQEHRETFHKGGLLARYQQRKDDFEYIDALTEEDKEVLRYEINHRWHQPFRLYFLVILCAGSAIVQGMDQTAVNGAQVSDIYPRSVTLAYRL